MTVSTFEEVTKSKPRRLSPRSSRRKAAATTTAGSRRATRAAATSAATARVDFKLRRTACREGRRDRVRPEPLARIALLHYADGAKS
jgi:hypothetical protein